ncbi:MAG: bifunctional glutamate N-acetyltransferase/amino-acid acetyltransferase ArgJ [Gammaproteobacteria bacterium]
MQLGPGIFRTPLPQGFTAGGINCGVRRYRPDLGIIITDRPSVAVGVFTQNLYAAAPVNYCRALLPANNIRAIITNSGQANAATGPLGEQYNHRMAQHVANVLDCDIHHVLTASTGIIGEPLAIDKITSSIPTLIHHVSNIAEKFAVAILTTDLVPKTVHKTLKLSQGHITLTGICKGSGMIHPNMATMLGYLLTDAQLTTAQAQQLLTNACDQSFNMVSVDGETSTNDSVFLLANGASGVSIATDDDLLLFQTALTEIAITLAKSIARDGEGASKLIEVQVTGVPELPLAKKIARELTLSPLIKTAIYGGSPNWGRIMARLGSIQPVAHLIQRCEIYLQDLCVFKHALPCQLSTDNLHALQLSMHNDTTRISIHFHQGHYQATAWGCDLTEKYVAINADYMT